MGGKKYNCPIFRWRDCLHRKSQGILIKKKKTNNTQKSIIFLHTNSEDMDIKNIILFTIALKEHEILRCKFSKICTGLVLWKLQNVNVRNPRANYMEGHAVSTD